MPYELLQFNLGTGQAQGYVLRGTGEHEGTNVSLSPREIDDALDRERSRLKALGTYRPGKFSLLKGDSHPSPDDARAVAEFLDRKFLLAHADRQALLYACACVGEFARSFAKEPA